MLPVENGILSLGRLVCVLLPSVCVNIYSTIWDMEVSKEILENYNGDWLGNNMGIEWVLCPRIVKLKRFLESRSLVNWGNLQHSETWTMTMGIITEIFCAEKKFDQGTLSTKLSHPWGLHRGRVLGNSWLCFMNIPIETVKLSQKHVISKLPKVFPAIYRTQISPGEHIPTWNPPSLRMRTLICF